MAHPPKATPHSDIDGVHQDEEANVEVAAKEGESAGSLARAQKHSIGRPNYSEHRRKEEDRSS